ncbi:MAG: histidine kinase [Firmicutes bacterium]|nr:histidine kinase [Bacillota bacterium]
MPPRKRIEILRKKIEDLKQRLPAHSVQPRILQELEQLEEELETLLEGRNSRQNR